MKTDDPEVIYPAESPHDREQREGRERMLRMWRAAMEVAAGMADGEPVATLDEDGTGSKEGT